MIIRTQVSGPMARPETVLSRQSLPGDGCMCRCSRPCNGRFGWKGRGLSLRQVLSSGLVRLNRSTTWDPFNCAKGMDCGTRPDRHWPHSRLGAVHGLTWQPNRRGDGNDNQFCVRGPGAFAITECANAVDHACDAGGGSGPGACRRPVRS